MRAGSLRCVVTGSMLVATIGCRPPGSRATDGVVSAVPSVVADTPWEPGCRTTDPAVLQGCVRPEALHRHLEQVVGPRPPGSVHWRRVQTHCDATLSALGFAVQRQVYPSGINVIGVRPGTTWPQQRVMVGAHYDHIPGCAGADDNASGVAGVLELARVLSGTSWPRSLVVACWDEEERGLLGSRAYATQARARDEEIVVYFNFDAIGFADARPHTQRTPPGFALLFPDEVTRLQARGQRADFIAIVADPKAAPWAHRLGEAAQHVALPHVVLAVSPWVVRSGAANDLLRSDHAAMWLQGYPAIMITDTAEYRSDAYHCTGRPDVLAHLDVGFATQVVGATVAAVASALRDPIPHQEPSPEPPTTPSATSREPAAPAHHDAAPMSALDRSSTNTRDNSRTRAGPG